MSNEEQIIIAAKEERRRYLSEWRKKNPDKVKAANERYWIKKAMKAIEAEKQNKESEGTE